MELLPKLLSSIDSYKRKLQLEFSDAASNPVLKAEMLNDRAKQFNSKVASGDIEAVLELATAAGPGVVRSKLPATNYLVPATNLVKDNLYREVSGANFLDLFGGDMPFGAPRKLYAETPDMALGQGSNKGIRYSIAPTSDMSAKINLQKPGLEQAYLNGMGEFEVMAQPSTIVKAMNSVSISQEAFSGLTKGEQSRLNLLLDKLSESGITVLKEGTK